MEFNKKINVHYNYDMDCSNYLFKQRCYPIGSGVNAQTGKAYIVFKADELYKFLTKKYNKYKEVM